MDLRPEDLLASHVAQLVTNAGAADPRWFWHGPDVESLDAAITLGIWGTPYPTRDASLAAGHGPRCPCRGLVSVLPRAAYSHSASLGSR